jgi:hypothetical protein
VNAFGRSFLFLVVLALLLWPGRLTAQLSVGHVKGLVIEKLTRFIEWPGGSLQPAAPFVICIQGSDETAEGLARVAGSRKWKGRTSTLRRLRAGADPGPCHILYLSSAEASRLPQVFAAVGGKPTLTVSDTPGFGERGVLINLYEEQGYPRFEINLPAVKRSPLNFNSQLFRLGRLVGDSPVP